MTNVQMRTNAITTNGHSTTTAPTHSEEPSYYGRLIVCRRRAGLGHDEYVRHYREVHYPLAIQMPNLLHYVQLPIEAAEDPSPAWDSVSLYVFPTAEHYYQAMQTEFASNLEEDSAYLMDQVQMQTFIVTVTGKYVASLGGKRWSASSQVS
ncbi:hypothetical protein L486_00681 [Kwoniella mangroviensis CBS 10435]|uniref:EthD domain-containing protein n=1 Tax=Kwoniella mangroviensis CBS 10435 TaxID=1331196 RepID=A0A1B9IZS8_9TREE|nr:uncharacterized protein I203_04213 [Kwoniella mangroviensis CBS 8507]OCF61037.1 hypothetical protein L486_00681 [Kwoniella mangroviensis CBS 10435]OCF66637.1 hypothetical protein I203_04213 [Kwoniella mangroviensis CBS 8507]OCF74215.1 hypothetical protein I204_04585 [Kwoniella mangroviensis CBS 8886]